MKRNTVTVGKETLRDELTYNGVTLLTYCIEYPRFCSRCFGTCLPGVNEFYKNRALEFRRYCETELFGMAVEQYEYDVENGFPVHVYEAVSKYEATYLRSCVISLYTDRYEYTGGAHGNTVRDSQTWNLKKCVMTELQSLILCPPDYKTVIFSEAEAQIGEDPDAYFENYRELLRENFSDGSFFCTPKGIAVYYQQYDIAPYSTGIPQFLIPYSYCVIDPAKLCPLSG